MTQFPQILAKPSTDEYNNLYANPENFDIAFVKHETIPVEELTDYNEAIGNRLNYYNESREDETVLDEISVDNSILDTLSERSGKNATEDLMPPIVNRPPKKPYSSSTANTSDNKDGSVLTILVEIGSPMSRTSSIQSLKQSMSQSKSSILLNSKRSRSKNRSKISIKMPIRSNSDSKSTSKADFLLQPKKRNVSIITKGCERHQLSSVRFYCLHFDNIFSCVSVHITLKNRNTKLRSK